MIISKIICTIQVHFAPEMCNKELMVKKN